MGHRSILGIVCGFCTIGLTAVHAEIPITAKYDSAWTEKDGIYTLDYPGKGYPALKLSFPVQKGKTYCFSCETRMDSPSRRVEGLYGVPGGQFEPYRNFLYAEKDGFETIRLYLNPGAKQQLQFRNCKVKKWDGGSTTENLLPNGDFENGHASSVWTIGSWGDPASGGIITPTSDFIQGKQSLKMLTPAPKKVNPLVSVFLPVREKSKLRLTFWAKADTPQGVRLNFDFGKQHGKHLYKLKTFSITSDWLEYEFEYEIPALEKPLVRLHLQREHADGNVWLDLMNLVNK